MPPNTKRWVIRRKAEVRGGLLSLEDACERYKLTIDEFLSWQRLIERCLRQEWGSCDGGAADLASARDARRPYSRAIMPPARSKAALGAPAICNGTVAGYGRSLL